ncbi:MAG: flagellar hook-associated protein FlgK, partial [Nitrosospira sp.]|nr:flagellar hook-associated protein FlgK [Nitrosospira sp.]
MNLANLGMLGLQVAQNRLQTTGHNITNVSTPGYSRQTVLTQTAGAASISAGWIGRGVQTVSVRRVYDAFLHHQLMDSQVKGAALTTYGEQISQINNLFADRTTGIAPALQKFFNGIQAVASAPADIAARQELLSRASSLATQIRSADGFFDDQRRHINTQINTTVTQTNSYLESIRDLNRQITTARGVASGQPPNDLLDKRDHLVSELGKLVDIQTFEQDGNINITVGNGQLVLGGDSVFPLAARPSDANPSRLAVNYTTLDSSGNPMQVEIPDEFITGGQLGGLLAFRREVLDTVQNDLGRLAAGLAVAINAAHKQGDDMSGVAGTNFFSFDPPKVLSNRQNTGTAVLNVGFDLADPNLSKALTNQDYRIEFDGTDYTVTSIPKGATFTLASVPTTFDGITFALASGTPNPGDSWIIQPTRQAASSLEAVITDPAKIAAAAVGAEVANGDNALAMAKLQTDNILGNGSMSPSEAFSQIVNKVGVLTQQNTSA